MGELRTATEGGTGESMAADMSRGAVTEDGGEHRAGTIVGEETRREEREMGGDNLTVSVKVL